MTPTKDTEECKGHDGLFHEPCDICHTKEDTDWVEEQIKELSCTYIPDGQPENYLKKEMLEKIHTILLAAKQRYFNEGFKLAEDKKFQDDAAQKAYDRGHKTGIEEGSALREKEILVALPNDDAVREWAENLTQEADKAWYASGAVWMRLKIRKIITKSLE